MTRHTYAGQTAIVGIGATEFSKASGRSELQLALEACVAACEDAGVDPSEVRGLSTFTMETNPETEIMRGLGIAELTHFSRIHFGGGAPCATVQYAAMAVASGVADYVLCYRAFNERSGRRFGAGVQDNPAGATAEMAQFAWTSPFGLLTPASWVAMFASRMMHEYGVTSEDFGRIAVADRRHAATNPAAFFYEQPITLADHQNSRWIVEP
ncbi:MAG TPA: lipid-transfer protein, partial [Micromonosporaceae bacterium]